MPAHDRLSRVFFENEQPPMLLPHHLFMLAAVQASKEAALLSLPGMEKIKPEKDVELETSTDLHCDEASTDGDITSVDGSFEEPSSEDNISNGQSCEEDEQKELRMIIQMSCDVKTVDDGCEQSLSLLLRFEDEMNRQLKCKIGEDETPIDLANELVGYGLINELDRDKVANKITESLKTPT